MRRAAAAMALRRAVSRHPPIIHRLLVAAGCVVAVHAALRLTLSNPFCASVGQRTEWAFAPKGTYQTPN